MNVMLQQLVKEDAKGLLDAASNHDWQSVKRIAKTLQENAEILILDDLYDNNDDEPYYNR